MSRAIASTSSSAVNRSVGIGAEHGRDPAYIGTNDSNPVGELIALSSMSAAEQSLRALFPLRGGFPLSIEIFPLRLDELIKSGIRNIVYKNIEKHELQAAIEATRDGKKFFSDEVLDLALESNEKKSVSE